MKVLGLTGMPGSGKSEAKHVAQEMGAAVVRMGDCIWEETQRRGLPLEGKFVGQVANEMREQHGPDVWALRTVEKIRAAPDSPFILIDGIRSNEEVAVFRRELGEDFVLIAIHTDPEHRFERMVKRARADDSVAIPDLQDRDDRELGWGIARTIALADYMLVNAGSLEGFHMRTQNLLRKITA